MKTKLQSLKFLVGILFVAVCLVFAAEDEEQKAVEKALEEMDVALEQLSFERAELITAHLCKGEEFFVNGELDRAEAEFKAVLEIVPDEERALVYLDEIQKRKERIQETEEKEERSRTELEKRSKERKSKVFKRKVVKTKAEQVQDHVLNGKKHYERGEYTSAIAEWEKVLVLAHPSDRDYKRVVNWINAAKYAREEKRKEAALHKKEEAREMVSRDVKEAWSVEEAEVEKREEEKEEAKEEITSAAKLKLQEKAMELVTVVFEDAHLRTVLRELSSMSGINIVLDENVFPMVEEEEEVDESAPAPEMREERAVPMVPGEGMPGVGMEGIEEEKVAPVVSVSPRVTIRLKDIPLVEALAVILRTKGLNYRLEENIIWIATEENLAAGELVTKSYKPSGGVGDIVEMLKASVPFAGTGAKAGGGGMGGTGAETGGGGSGVSQGPVGSNITVDRASSTIFVTNTPVNQRVVEDIIRQLSTTPSQASIETRFVDIDTDSLSQIGIQWDIPEPFEAGGDDAYIGGTSFDSDGKPTSGPGLDVGGGMPFGVSVKYSKLTPTKFEAIIQAFEASGESNLLSAPKVTVLNNYTATIEVIRPYPYIDSYSLEEETIEIGGDDFKISTAVPETATRDIGVMLEVTPGIGADKKLINLTLAPQVIELVDWLEYPAVTTTLRQPIFSVRYVTTNVDINDGETLVLGGLVRGEDVEAKQQIPFLGRIPVLGALFRTKTRGSQERELLIFVTARILEPTGQPLIRD